jgi:hypothetical protein
MNTTTPPFFHWVKSDLTRFWAVIGCIPVAHSLLLMLSYQVEDGFSLLNLGSSLLGYLPEALLLLLFLRYIKRGELFTPISSNTHARLSIETEIGATAKGSPRTFFLSAVKMLGGVYLFLWSAQSFIFDVGYFIPEELVSFFITVSCYCFALKETRLVQRNDSHDAVPRLLGAAALYLLGQNIAPGLSTKLFFDYFFSSSWLGLSALGLVSVALYYEQRRYLLTKTIFLNKSALYQIEAINPLQPVNGLLPLAYWPEVGCDGILYRIEPDSPTNDPFRINQVKVPLFLVPIQPEPFLGFLRRRLYWFVALFLISLALIFGFFSTQP